MANEQVLNLKLVEEIEKRPILYNNTLSEYSIRDVSDKAWNEVANAVGLGMTMADCKERWKNLRAVFVRHMKPGRTCCGAKVKKPYYLADAMRFAIPYVKTLNKPPGNMPNVPQPERDEFVENNDHEDRFAVFGQHSQSSASLDYTYAQSSSMPSTQFSPRPQQQGSSNEQHTEPGSRRKRILGNEAVTNAFLEYLEAKKAKLERSSQHRNPRSESLRMFLLSMQQDLEAMTDLQVREFKRRCLVAIDELRWKSK